MSWLTMSAPWWITLLVGIISFGGGSLMAYIVKEIRDKRQIYYRVESLAISTLGVKGLELLFNKVPVQTIVGHTIIVGNSGRKTVDHIPLYLSSKNGMPVDWDFIPGVGVKINGVKAPPGKDLELIIDSLQPNDEARIIVYVPDAEVSDFSVLPKPKDVPLRCISSSAARMSEQEKAFLNIALQRKSLAEIAGMAIALLVVFLISVATNTTATLTLHSTSQSEDTNKQKSH